MSTLSLPTRTGPRAQARPVTPHQQLDQNAPLDLQEQLWERMIELDHVRSGPSLISAPDTRALHLDPAVALGPREAFVPTDGTEFAHLHGAPDGSLHVHLPADVAEAAIGAGWAELHPIAVQGLVPPVLVMVYGPRDEEELEVVWRLVQRSYEFARGRPDRRTAGDAMVEAAA